MTRLGVIGHGGRISSVIKHCLRNYDPELRVVGIVRGKGASRSTIRMGIQSAYACLAARDSLASGRLEKVRQVGGGWGRPTAGSPSIR
jgi:hypothetical protein